MSRQYWVSPIPPMHNVDGLTYNTSTTLTDISPGAASTNAVILPANILEIGSELELVAYGNFANSATTPTLLLGFYYGGVAGTALAASAAITTANTATVAWPWMMKYNGVVRATGTSGSIVGQGVLYFGTALTTFSLNAIPITQALRTVTIDTTVAKAVTVGAQWGTSAAANIAFCNDISVRLIS